MHPSFLVLAVHPYACSKVRQTRSTTSRSTSRHSSPSVRSIQCWDASGVRGRDYHRVSVALFAPLLPSHVTTSFRDIEHTGFVAHVDLFTAAPPEKDASGVAGSGSSSPSKAVPKKIVKTKRDVGENLTASLFGSTFVHANPMTDMGGEPVIFFVFSVSKCPTFARQTHH